MVGGRGRGSNLRALVAEFNGDASVSVVSVIATASDSPALEWAEGQNLRTAAIPPRPSETYASRLLEHLHGVEWICLAGYLNLLPPEVLAAFPGRILNIHPALLPKFGGKGMYGLHVHSAVLAANETVSGCTVHYVSEVYDEGEVLAQATCPVMKTDTPETLAARVLRLEHLLYPEAVRFAIERARA